MHVCIITSSFPLDPGDGRAAAGLFVRDFAVALAELGEQVTVLTPDKHGGPKADVPGVQTHWFAWCGGDKPLAYLKPWRPLDALAIWSLLRNGRRALRELAASEKFDHVLAMWAVPAGYLAMGLQKQTGTPFTTWCLGSDIWTYGKRLGLRNIVRRVLQRSTHVYADGIELGHAATRLCGRPVSFLPSSRQLDPALAESPPAGKRSFNFLFIGRYAEVKGVDVLLAAMREMVESGQDASLYMFGGGPMEGFVRDYVAAHGLGERVHVGGYADLSTLVTHLAFCDCLVIPSRMESIPVAFSDALQMGRPLIVSDVGDMGTLLREVAAGYVVVPDDVTALTDAMRRMVMADATEFAPHIEKLAQRFELKRAAQKWLDAVG